MIRFKPIPEDIFQRIESLTKFFQEEPDIIFAYLFGGLLRGGLSPLSDVDLAVYVKNVKELDYLTLFSDITNLLGTDEVDLVILNSSPVSLTGRILTHKSLLVDKKPFFRHEYESLVLRKFFDFAIKEKAIIKRRYKIG